MSWIQQTYNKLPRNIVPVEHMVHKTERKWILVLKWKMLRTSGAKVWGKIRCKLC